MTAGMEIIFVSVFLCGKNVFEPFAFANFFAGFAAVKHLVLVLYIWLQFVQNDYNINICKIFFGQDFQNVR